MVFLLLSHLFWSIIVYSTCSNGHSTCISSLAKENIAETILGGCIKLKEDDDVVHISYPPENWQRKQNQRVVWMVIGPEETRIQIAFSYFDLHRPPECLQNRLLIIDNIPISCNIALSSSQQCLLSGSPQPSCNFTVSHKALVMLEMRNWDVTGFSLHGRILKNDSHQENFSKDLCEKKMGNTSLSCHPSEKVLGVSCPHLVHRPMDGRSCTIAEKQYLSAAIESTDQDPPPLLIEKELKDTGGRVGMIEKNISKLTEFSYFPLHHFLGMENGIEFSNGNSAKNINTDLIGRVNLTGLSSTRLDGSNLYLVGNKLGHQHHDNIAESQNNIHGLDNDTMKNINVNVSAIDKEMALKNILELSSRGMQNALTPELDSNAKEFNDNNSVKATNLPVFLAENASDNAHQLFVSLPLAVKVTGEVLPSDSSKVVLPNERSVQLDENNVTENHDQMHNSNSRITTRAVQFQKSSEVRNPMLNTKSQSISMDSIMIPDSSSLYHDEKYFQKGQKVFSFPQYHRDVSNIPDKLLDELQRSSSQATQQEGDVFSSNSHKLITSDPVSIGLPLSSSEFSLKPDLEHISLGDPVPSKDAVVGSIGKINTYPIKQPAQQYVPENNHFLLNKLSQRENRPNRESSLLHPTLSLQPSYVVNPLPQDLVQLSNLPLVQGYNINDKPVVSSYSQQSLKTPLSTNFHITSVAGRQGDGLLSVQDVEQSHPMENRKSYYNFVNDKEGINQIGQQQPLQVTKVKLQLRNRKVEKRKNSNLEYMVGDDKMRGGPRHRSMNMYKHQESHFKDKKNSQVLSNGRVSEPISGYNYKRDGGADGDPIRYVTIKLNMDYLPAYGDPNSNNFKRLYFPLKASLSSLYCGIKGFLGVDVDKIMPGSVRVLHRLIFSDIASSQAAGTEIVRRMVGLHEVELDGRAVSAEPEAIYTSDPSKNNGNAGKVMMADYCTESKEVCQNSGSCVVTINQTLACTCSTSRGGKWCEVNLMHDIGMGLVVSVLAVLCILLSFVICFLIWDMRPSDEEIEGNETSRKRSFYRTQKDGQAVRQSLRKSLATTSGEPNNQGRNIAEEMTTFKSTSQENFFKTSNE